MLKGVNNYVMGPSLNILCYDVADSNTLFIETGVPRLLTSDEQTELKHQFQYSWNEHLGECNFGCEDMIWPTP